METGRIAAGGVSLRYAVTGEGPDMVLVHGASGNLGDWSFGPMGRLATMFRVLAFDRPGLGRSEALPHDGIAEQARAMAAAARSLGMSRPVLAGHSFGGSVALRWALDAPVAGLILISAPSHVWPGGTGRLYDLLTTPVVGYLASHALPHLARARGIARHVAPIFAPQPIPAGYLAHIEAELSIRPATLRRNAAQVNRLKGEIAAMVPLYDRLSDLPVEILHGLADTIVPAHIHSAPLAARLPHAGYRGLPGIGHMPHHAAPEALEEAARAILARIANSPRPPDTPA